MTKATIDLGYPTDAHGRIPAFSSVDEEAEFWDTHDFTDYWQDSETVDLVVGPLSNQERGVMVPLTAAEGLELDRRAQDLGIGSSSLIRKWVLERLSEDRKAS